MQTLSGSCPLLGHRVIEEISNQLSEHIFETELFDKLIIAPRMDMSRIKFAFTHNSYSKTFSHRAALHA